MKRCLAVCILSIVLGSVGCKTTGSGGPERDASVLSKTEVLQLVSGKTYKSDRGSGPIGTISVSADGKLFGETSQASSMGEWEVKEDGTLCFHWDNTNWARGCGVVKRTEKPNVYKRSAGGTAYTMIF